MFTDIFNTDKKYNIIYADPPWTYAKTGGTKNSRGIAKQHYNTMSLSDIKGLPISTLAADNCALFMWATFPQIVQAIEAIKAWGFEYFNAAFVWVKRNPDTGKDAFGMGYWTRANPEVCLLAFKGKMKPVRHDIRQLVYAPAQRHSEKPNEVRNLIKELCGDLPRIELFARQSADGWDCWGNEVGKFDEEASV